MSTLFRTNFLLFVLSLTVGFVAVTDQSLWIDEANTAVKAIEPTWAGFRGRMALERGSDLQMPLYMVAIWAWEKVAGPSEFALRALNIPFLLFSLGSILFLLDVPRFEKRSFALFVICSPMLWVYLDEARPYVLQFLGATLFFIALLNLATGSGRPRSRELILALVAGFVLSGASLTGVIYTFFLGLAFLVLWQKREPVARLLLRPNAVLTVVIWGILMAGLVSYYIWTLQTGARASSVGATTPATVLFCFYELIGAGGWGPGRTALRETGTDALKATLPWLSLFFLAAIAFLLAGVAVVRDRLPLRCFPAIPFVAAVMGAGVTVILGILMDFRVLGRHLIPVLPAGLYLTAFIFIAIWQSNRIVLRVLGIFYVCMLFISCLNLRFSARFAKDAYREASAITLQTVANGEVCWWAADRMGAEYYGLNPVHAGDTGEVYLANNRDISYLNLLPEPRIVVLSKPDIYDPEGVLLNLLLERSYIVSITLPAMTIWKKE